MLRMKSTNLIKEKFVEITSKTGELQLILKQFFVNIFSVNENNTEWKTYFMDKHYFS